MGQDEGRELEREEKEKLSTLNIHDLVFKFLIFHR